MKSVVVIGGGFGGLEVARNLGGFAGTKITLVDRRNYHLFQPLLYQIAMAGLSPADIAVPLRSVLSGYKNVDVLLGNVQSVNKVEKKVTGDFGELHYDFLVLACGAKHSYFGHNDWEEFAPGLKTLEQATEIRRRVFLAYEKAEREKDSAKQRELLTFVIIGGGPTGVELAGALGEISRYTLSKDFRHIDPTRTRIVLIEAGTRVLSSFSEKLSARAARDLEALGVTVWTSTRVTQVTSEGVFLGSETIKAGTVIWAAGVQPSSLGKVLDTPLDPVGRVVVEKNLRIPKSENIFVIGDQAAFFDDNGKQLPGVAQVAIQQGRFVANEIKNAILPSSTGQQNVFRYRDKGQMATIGRSSAVVQTKHFELTGFVAWCAWLFVHVYFLIGFKNRIFVLLQWAWSYSTFKRGARLIVNKEWKSTVSAN